MIGVQFFHGDWSLNFISSDSTNGRSTREGRSTLEKMFFFFLLLNLAAVITLAVYVGIKDDVNVTCTMPTSQEMTSHQVTEAPGE